MLKYDGRCMFKGKHRVRGIVSQAKYSLPIQLWLFFLVKMADEERFNDILI